MTNGIIKGSFRINLLIMKLCCMYPSGELTISYRIRAYLMYVFFVIPAPVFANLHLLLEEDLDVEKVNYNAAFLAQTTCFITKFLPFILQSRRIKECVLYFESPFFDVTKDVHKNMIETTISVCRRNTFAFLVCAVGAVGSWATKPFFWKGRQLPVDVWLPFDQSKDLVTYCFTYFYVAIGPIIASLAVGVIDPLIAGLASHATTQIKILKDNLQHLDEHAEDELSQKCVNGGPELRKGEIIYEKITRCITHYDAILKFIKEYEVCFTWVIFSQIAGSVFVICFCCLQLSQIETFGYYFLQLIVYLSVIMGEIYFYCYYGSALSEESETLINAIYMGTWYNYDAKCKKALILLMERSKKPVIVTSGKIVELSLVTFTVILKRSYSLLAVLKTYA